MCSLLDTGCSRSHSVHFWGWTKGFSGNVKGTVSRDLRDSRDSTVASSVLEGKGIGPIQTSSSDLRDSRVDGDYFGGKTPFAITPSEFPELRPCVLYWGVGWLLHTFAMSESNALIYETPLARLSNLNKKLGHSTRSPPHCNDIHILVDCDAASLQKVATGLNDCDLSLVSALSNSELRAAEDYPSGIPLSRDVGVWGVSMRRDRVQYPSPKYVNMTCNAPHARGVSQQICAIPHESKEKQMR